VDGDRDQKRGNLKDEALEKSRGIAEQFCHSAGRAGRSSGGSSSGNASPATR
jgi:hypothetical protein